jgi:hypothetical protein
MTKILGISAKKQGGKNTSLNYIFGQTMCDLGVISEFQIDDKGRLIVPTVDSEGKISWGGFDPLSRDPMVRQFMAETMDPYIKAYSFADPLKAFCVDVLGLEPHQCYGTDDQKNELTQYKWADFESVLPPMHADLNGYNLKDYMTGRQILQIVGTDMMRSINNDIWVNATINAILRDAPGIAIICDVRFPGEVIKIQDHGGKVMRLMRAPFSGDDEHSSETALDDYEGFDALVDNRDVSILENNMLIKDQLIEFWGNEVDVA